MQHIVPFTTMFLAQNYLQVSNNQQIKLLKKIIKKNCDCVTFKKGASLIKIIT